MDEDVRRKMSKPYEEMYKEISKHKLKNCSTIERVEIHEKTIS